jgi:hypothetical protein
VLVDFKSSEEGYADWHEYQPKMISNDVEEEVHTFQKVRSNEQEAADNCLRCMRKPDSSSPWPWSRFHALKTV